MKKKTRPEISQMPALPAFLIAERDALTEEIYRVFGDVSRAGGVSWSESEALDMYGSKEDCAAARAKDKDRRWQELVEDPIWRSEPGVGGFSFLDDIGFRYYLPAGMIRSIREGSDSGVEFHLCHEVDQTTSHTRDQARLLGAEQRTCVKRYLEFMAVIEAVGNLFSDKATEFRVAISYWASPPPENEA